MLTISARFPERIGRVIIDGVVVCILLQDLQPTESYIYS